MVNIGLQTMPNRYAPPDTDNEVDLRLSRDVEVTRSTSSALQTDLLLLSGEVLLHVLLSTLEDDLALGLRCLANRVCQYTDISCLVRKH